MSETEIQFPDVNYGPANKEKMRELTTSEWSPFFGKDYWEVFIFSMGYAYAKGLKPKKVRVKIVSRCYIATEIHLWSALSSLRTIHTYLKKPFLIKFWLHFPPLT